MDLAANLSQRTPRQQKVDPISYQGAAAAGQETKSKDVGTMQTMLIWHTLVVFSWLSSLADVGLQQNLQVMSWSHGASTLLTCIVRRSMGGSIAGSLTLRINACTVKISNRLYTK